MQNSKPRQQELTFDSKQTAQLSAEQRQQTVAALAALILSAVTRATEKCDEAR